MINLSDDFAFGAEAADVDTIPNFEPEVDWTSDPLAILIAREEHGDDIFE